MDDNSNQGASTTSGGPAEESLRIIRAALREECRLMFTKDHILIETQIPTLHGCPELAYGHIALSLTADDEKRILNLARQTTVFLPNEPTEEMLGAILDAFYESDFGDEIQMTPSMDIARDAYARLLVAIRTVVTSEAAVE